MRLEEVAGVPIATVLLPAANLGVMLLPLMLFHQIQLLMCAAIARRLGARAAATAAAVELQRVG